MRNKRGQITIFIIIGILMVFVLAFIFLVTRVTVGGKEILARPVTEDIPVELNPIFVYTEECLRQTAIDGLMTAGQHGGHIYPMEIGEYSADATNSDGIMFSDDSAIPYWLYNKIPNEGGSVELATLKPPLKRADGGNSIEEQLARYVNENLKNCLGEYEIFAEQEYVVKEHGDVETTATILPGHVTFYTEYPIDVFKGRLEKRMSSFFTDISVDLHGIYEIAENITKLEQEYVFLENGALNWIASFTAIDENKLPPMSEMEFKLSGSTFWLEADVEKNLKSMLSSYVPMFRIMPSNNFYRYEYPASISYADVLQRVYDNTIINVERPNNFDINFDYLPLWPIYLDMDDEGGIIRPESLSVSFPMIFFGMQNYRNVYDISYPVMVSVGDENALNGAGYKFIFALEANIRNNQPVEDKDVFAEKLAFFDNDMVCDANQRTSAEYTIAVSDAYDSKGIADAQVYFSFGKDCFIGTTDEYGVLKTKLPVGYGGTLKIAHNNYLTTSILLDPKIEETNTGIKIEMNKFEIVKISVDKKKLAKTIQSKKKFNWRKIITPGLKIPVDEIKDVIWVLNPKPVSLEDNEAAVVTLTRISEMDQQFSTGATVIGNESQEARLVPGIYEVNVELILDEDVLIPAEERCFEKPGFVPGEGDLGTEECITINAIALEQLPNGGAQLDNESRYFYLNPNNLYSSSEIVFYAISPAITDIPAVSGMRVAEDLEQIGRTSYYSKLYRNELEPDYK